MSWSRGIPIQAVLAAVEAEAGIVVVPRPAE